MIQRIQTVYLALVAVLCTVCLCSTIGRFEGDVEAMFTNFTFEGVSVPGGTGPYALGIMLILVILLTVMSIFLFRHRMRQLRITIFTTILLVGYVGVYALMVWLYYQKLTLSGADVHYQLAIGAVYPVICIIFNCMAIHGIRKDEALVRSLDRLR